MHPDLQSRAEDGRRVTARPAVAPDFNRLPWMLHCPVWIFNFSTLANIFTA